MKSITSKISIIILSLMASTFTFAEELHEGCTNQNPNWQCGHCCPPEGCNWPLHGHLPDGMQCTYGLGPNGERLAPSGEFTCNNNLATCTAAQLYKSWTGCGPGSGIGSCYGKPAPPPSFGPGMGPGCVTGSGQEILPPPPGC
jgi:hypothetical protein